jgi:hypothetical protein
MFGTDFSIPPPSIIEPVRDLAFVPDRELDGTGRIFAGDSSTFHSVSVTETVSAAVAWAAPCASRGPGRDEQREHQRQRGAAGVRNVVDTEALD